MASPDYGGGGGRAGTESTDQYALDKPYDVGGPPSAEKMALIDEMLGVLFKGLTRGRTAIDVLRDALADSLTATTTTAASPIFTDYFELSSAQIMAMPTTPIQIVDTPANATDLIIPIALVVETDTTVGAAVGRSYVIEYADAAFVGFTLVTVSADLNNVRKKMFATDSAPAGNSGTNYATRDPRGKGLNISLDGAPGGAGTSTARGKVVYYKLLAADTP